MTTITTAEAAIRANVTPHTIRTWCRTGQLAATKQGRRWVVSAASLGRRLRAPFRQPSDWLRRGVAARQLTGRPLRRAAARQLARATSREYQIPLIGHRERARIALANSGHTVARDYLFSLDLDVEFIEEFESAFGRKTAEAYRINHRAEPDTRGLVVLHGRLWHVARYADVTDLHRGAAAYARTRGLFELVA